MVLAQMAQFGWWALAIIGGIVAALAAVFLGRKDTPRWLSAPLFIAATLLAGLGGFQSILDLRARDDAATNCASARPVSAEELNALSVLVRNSRADSGLQRDFACAFAAAVAPEGLSEESRSALVAAAASLSSAPDAKKRQALLAVQNASTRGAAIDTLLKLAQTADDFKKVGALAAAAETQRALEAYRAALELAPKDAAAQTGLGDLLLREGDLRDAEGVFRSLLAQPNQDPAFQTAALLNLGDIARAHQDLSSAEKFLQQALRLGERNGDKDSIARALTKLGEISRVRNDAKAASDYFARALTVFEQLGRRDDAAEAHLSLGNLAAGADAALARGHFRLAKSGFERIGDKSGQARTLSAMGRLALDEDDARTAEKFLKRALPLQEAAGSKAGQAATLADLGEAARRRRRFDEAERYLQSAQDLAERIGDRASLAQVSAQRGALALDRGDLAQAETQLRQALQYYGEAQLQTGAARARVELARVFSKQGNASQAKSELQQAVQAFDGAGRSQDAARAREQLARL